MESEKPKNHLILIGNPGVGKSTILNGLIGGVKFEAGVRLGKGITTVLKKATDAFGNIYMDTPGLSDVILRKEAAKQIQEGLQAGGLFRVFFVVTLESGRLRVDDMTTINLVLDAALDIKNSFSLIINKVLPEELEIMKDRSQWNEFVNLINGSLPYATKSIFANPMDILIAGKKNQIPNLSQELLSFISNAPMKLIKKSRVKEINAESFQDMQAWAEKQMEKLQKDRDFMTQKLAEQAASLLKFQKKQEELQLRHSAEREDFLKQMAVLEKSMKGQQNRHEEELRDAKKELHKRKRFYHGDPNRGNYFWIYPSYLDLVNPRWDFYAHTCPCNNKKKVPRPDPNLVIYECLGHD